MIQAQLEDGRMLEFPDGTDPKIVQSAVKKMLSKDDSGVKTSKSQENGIFSGLPAETVDLIRSQSLKKLNARGRPKKEPSLDFGKAEKMAKIERIRLRNPMLAKQIEETGGLEAFLVGAGEGFHGLARGVGLAEKPDETTKLALEGLRGQSTAANAGKLTAQAAPFLIPGGAAANIASTPLRVAAMGAVGASEGGIVASGDDRSGKDVAQSAGAGLLLGAGGEVLLPIINSMGRKLVSNRKGREVEEAVTPDGAPTPELEEALDDVGMSFDEFVDIAAEKGSPAENAKRAQVFEDLGVQPTEAQRTRDTDLFVQQQDSFRKSGKVRTALEDQEEILSAGALEQVSKVGGRAQNAGSSPIEAITGKAIELDKEISNLYQSARESLPKESIVIFDKTAKFVREAAPLDARSEGTLSALTQRMKQQGFLNSENRVKSIRNITGKRVAQANIEKSEGLRQYANSLHEGANPQGRQIIRQFKDALDDDVFKAAGDDFFKSARASKTNFERGLSPDKLNKFDQRKVSLVRDIRDNLVNEDDIVDKVLKRSSKYKSSDLVELKNYLTSGTEAQIKQGQKAWDDVRTAALERIREKAFRGPVTQSGTQSLSRAALQSALKEMGENKFKVLFTSNERIFIRKLASIAALREPPPGTFTGSGPSAPAIQQLEKTIVEKVPVFGEMYGSIKEAILNKATEKRVLELVDDVAKIEKENAKAQLIRLRRSKAASALTAAPVAATAGVSSSSGEE